MQRLEGSSASGQEGSTGFKTVETGEFAVHIEGTMALQSQALAEHEGQIKGLNTAVQAVQSSVNFWQTTALGVAAVLLAITGLVATFQIKLADDISDQSEDFSRVEQRVGSLETKVDALPGRISESLRSTSRDLVLITQAGRETRASEEDKAD